MAWERRRQGWFYYRTERAGGRFRKQYFGNGSFAALLAHQDELRKEHRATAQERCRQLKREIKRADSVLEGLGNLIDVLAATLN